MAQLRLAIAQGAAECPVRDDPSGTTMVLFRFSLAPTI